MKTLRTVLTLALAALLITPSAHAAKTSKKSKTKISPEARGKMAEGLAALERGENSAAIAAFTKAVRAQGTVSSYFLLGWAHYQRAFKFGSPETADRDDAQSAIDAYAMALGRDPSLRELPDASRLYFSMALCYEALSSYDKALDSYKTAFHAAPDKALIPMHAARLRLKMNDAAKAVSNVELAMRKAASTGSVNALRDAARRDPAFAPLMAEPATRKALGIGAAESEDLLAAVGARGDDMRDAVRDAAFKPAAQDQAVLEKIAEGNIELKFRRYASAVAAYQAALTLDERSRTLGAAQSAMIHENLGAAYNRLGQPDTAVNSLQKALQQNPLNPSAHYQIALAYALSGKTAMALNALRESFSACASPSDLRRFLMLAKTDMEFEAVRDLSGFHAIVAQYADRVALR